MTKRQLFIASFCGIVLLAFLVNLYTSSVTGQTTSSIAPRNDVDRYYRGVRIAFITSNVYDGNLGGLVGADAKCNSDSNRPLKNIRYRAYLQANKDVSRQWTGGDKLLIVGPPPSLTKQLWTMGNTVQLSSVWSGGYTNTTTFDCTSWTTNSATTVGELLNGLKFDGSQSFTGYNTCSGLSDPKCSCDKQQPLLCIEWYE